MVRQLVATSLAGVDAAAQPRGRCYLAAMSCPHPDDAAHHLVDDARVVTGSGVVVADDGVIRHRRAVVAGFHTRRCDADAAPGAHHLTHSYAALAFYVAGGASLQMRSGGSRPDADRWNVEAGDVLIVPAGMAHRADPARGLLRSVDDADDADEAAFWGVALCAPCLIADDVGLLRVFEQVRDGAAAVARIPEARRPWLTSLFEELSALATSPPPDVDHLERSLLTLILREVQRARPHLPVGAQAVAGSTKSVVVEALRHIERHCLRPLTLREVAEAVGRSPAYVTTALTRATGRSAKAWIVSGRLAEARRLLLHSDELVDVIAERVGYADVTHFIRMFRREHGVTPAAWRAARLETGN